MGRGLSVHLPFFSFEERQLERTTGKPERRSGMMRLMSVGAGASFPEAHCDSKTTGGLFLCHNKRSRVSNLLRAHFEMVG